MIDDENYFNDTFYMMIIDSFWIRLINDMMNDMMTTWKLGSLQFCPSLPNGYSIRRVAAEILH